MRKRVSIARSMPYAFALVSGVFVASYMFTAMYAEMSIGRPSSTASLGIVVAPVLSLVVALIGFVVGFFPRFFLRKRGDSDLAKQSTLIAVIALVTLLAGAISGGIALKQVIDYEQFNSPRLLSNSAAFSKAYYSRNGIPTVSKDSALVWESSDRIKAPFEWGDARLTASVHHSDLLSINSGDTSMLSYDFDGYTYITRVRLLAVTDRKGAPYLTVLVRLRATSYRSMLLIYDENYDLVYEELLERCGTNEYLGSFMATGGEVVVVGVCRPFRINIEKPV